MVFSKAEQKILMNMLKCERLKQSFQPEKNSYFYNTMKILEKCGCVVIKRKSDRRFQLTNYGRCIASLIVKHPNSDPKYKKHAYVIELGLMSWISRL